MGLRSNNDILEDSFSATFAVGPLAYHVQAVYSGYYELLYARE